MRRRRLLRLLGGIGAGAGAARAADNVLLGYGVVTGTNLREQDLEPELTDDVLPREWEYAAADSRLWLADGTLTVAGPDGERALSPTSATPEAAAQADAVHALPGAPVREVVADLGSLDAGTATFSFHEPSAFFDRLATGAEAGDPRPYTVDALRGAAIPPVDPATVEAFVGGDPADPRAVLAGLVEGFRRHATYDLERYAAGAVEDNLLRRTVDLRGRFRESVEFEALLESEGETGMFCYEFVDRSLEALHAVPAPDQTRPVAGLYVSDWRHKHAYTGVASALRTPDGDLEIPVTFVDYTHTTLYDDLRLTGLLGEGLNAYNDRHYADRIAWVRH